MGEYQHSQSLSNPSRRAWIAQARSVRIEDELERRGIMLNGRGPERRGPCLWCRSFDRLAVNVSTQQWSCSTCQRAGDVVALVQHFDRVDFLRACRTLCAPPEREGASA
jgi:hypothetical protein